MKFVYPAILKELNDGSCRGWIPDLEGCEAEGPSEESVMRELKQEMNGWILTELEEEDGELPVWSIDEHSKVGSGERVQLLAVNVRFVDGYDE